MARPDTAISVIYQRFHNFGMALLGRPIFGNNILTEREYELVLELANYVLTVMDAEWGWHPRMSSRLGLYRLVQMPGSHQVNFTNPELLALKIVEAGRD